MKRVWFVSDCVSLWEKSRAGDSLPILERTQQQQNLNVYRGNSTMEANKTRITINDEIADDKQNGSAVFIKDNQSDKPIRTTRANKNTGEDIHWKTDVKADDQCYFLKLEGNLKSEDVVGPHSLDNVTRKEFLISELKFYLHAHMELWGSADQVEIAELTIVREISKIYKFKTCPFLDANLEVLKLEVESGAWILVDPLEIPTPRHITMRRLPIFGNREFFFVHQEAYKPIDTEPSGLVQAADEHKDVVFDHQLIDSNDFIKEQTVDRGKLSMEANKTNLELIDHATINDENTNFTEFDVFLRKIQSVKPMKSPINKQRNQTWENVELNWPTPPSYRPTSPAYVPTSHDVLSLNFTSLHTYPSNPYDLKPPSFYSHIPPNYSPTSSAYMFTAHVYIHSPRFNSNHHLTTGVSTKR
ncbi:hypothetical protein QVD17_15104 [Tagetes erecta]|uniref:Uncharacterized protein n=1 Tax=Tagetes erecta TaxID=13708 RepID=A0AAD8KUA6_TARER|nr:hypothetical protein QVD17_15104 [Tagetes erecta]